jgi:hypothetical protein
MTDSGPRIPTVNARRLATVLEEAGWRRVGGRRDVYSRFAPPGAESERYGGLVVPLDSAAPEYQELMDAAIAELSSAQHRDIWQRTIMPRLSLESADEFRFRKDSAAPSGLIAWRQGENLIEAARAALIAGAKAYMEPGRRHYSNLHGQFAGRYLDTVLMGQTGVGSYIVTALAPSTVSVPLKGGRVESLGIEGVDITPARKVTSAIVTAIDATVEAVAHHRSTGSFSGFDDRLNEGISFEMASALRNLSRDADEAEIVIEWDSQETTTPRPSRTFEFQSGDAAVLNTVADRFAAAEPQERATLIGRVHLLTKKEAGGPGVFGIETLSKQGRKVRVRLAAADDYHKAVRAHDEDLAIRVTGGLTREGQLSWLYNARVVEVLGSYIELRDLQSPKEGNLSQETLFGDAD